MAILGTTVKEHMAVLKTSATADLAKTKALVPNMSTVTRANAELAIVASIVKQKAKTLTEDWSQDLAQQRKV